MTIYNVHHTNKNLGSINIDEEEIDQSTDVTLFGRKKLRYGQEMNQNLLHLLEHFACPESSDGKYAQPDLTAVAHDSISNIEFLSNPINGQLWYNSTQQALFFYDVTLFRWIPLGMQEDIAANWGVIYNGQQLPKPVSEITGRVFEYNECSWIVSAYKISGQIDYMICQTNQSAAVTAAYQIDGDPTIYEGYATYLIVGIKGNINLGTLAPIPSPTPTPSITPSITPTNGLPTPTPTSLPVTPTPTPSAQFNGDLAIAAINPNAFGGFFAGQVNPFFDGDVKAVKYPGITDTRYQLYQAPTAPHNPWVPNGGKYYLYINSSPFGGTLGTFPATNPLFNKYVFCSNDGINGVFYRILSITDISGNNPPSFGIYRLELSTNLTIQSSYFNIPPTQTSSIPQLAFAQYQYVYAVGAYYTNYSPGELNKFQLLTPTPYLQNFDLYIYGGTPPYTISDVRYHTQGGGSYPVSAIASGMTNENFSGSPVNFRHIATVANKFKGLVTLANPNVSLVNNGISAGYKISNYITADISYPVGAYLPVYTPEMLWQYFYSQGSYVEGPGSVNYTGNASELTSDMIEVEVTDSASATLIYRLTAPWKWQQVDNKLPNRLVGLNASITGPTSTLSPNVTPYSWAINLSMDNPVTSVVPTIKFSDLTFRFSIIKPTVSNITGSWDGALVSGTTLAVPAGGGVCYANGLVHIGNTTPLTPITSHQTVHVTKYVDIFGVEQNISGTPIILNFFVTNSPNTFTWRALKTDGTNNNLSESSPLVPYDMQLDVTIPLGLPAPGSLQISLIGIGFVTCFTTSGNAQDMLIQLNFTNV